MIKKRDLNVPRPVKTKQTRDRIFNAAVKLMNKYGYEYLTIRNICEAADVSTGTFYHHFKTKDDLLSVYLDNSYNKYLSNCIRDTADLNIKDKILLVYCNYSKYCKESGLAFISNYYAVKNKALDSRHKLTARQLDIIDEVEKAQEEGMIITELSSYTICLDLGDICKGVIFDWCQCDAVFDLTDCLQRLMSIYIKGIVTEKFVLKYGQIVIHEDLQTKSRQVSFTHLETSD